jgi:hypothetical protein
MPINRTLEVLIAVLVAAAVAAVILAVLWPELVEKPEFLLLSHDQPEG